MELKRQDLGIIEIGFYKGKRWADLPEDYVHYLAQDECRVPEAVKQTVRKELEQRKFLDGQMTLFEG